MAKIVKADDAPDGNVRVTYTGGEFEVGGRGYKSDDAAELEAANGSPFLEVKYDAPDESAAAHVAHEADVARVERDNASKAAVAAAREGDPEAAPAPEPTKTPKETK